MTTSLATADAVIGTDYTGLSPLFSSVVTELGVPHQGYGETSLTDRSVVSTALRCSGTATRDMSMRTFITYPQGCLDRTGNSITGWHRPAGHQGGQR